MRFLFISMNNMGNELTGGDTIWMELFHYWSKEHTVSLHISKEAENLLWHERGNPVEPTLFNIAKNTIQKLKLGLKTLPLNPYDYVYSVSDFYPDLIPAFVYKWKNPKCKWIAGYYLVVCPPFAPGYHYKGFNRLKGFLYWLMQIPSRWVVNKWADIVFVTSEPDRKYFPNKKVVIIRGGVSEYGEKNKNPKYDAIFIGRFHYQKGVLELLDIWKTVVYLWENAKLCMVGDGPLRNEVLMKREKLGLRNNIDIVGFKKGREKYALIQDSKMVVHPATFDSGGMACAEAMAFGLPAIGFDLPAYETYYPKGMVKVKTNKDFAHQITKFLCNNGYPEYSKQAKELIMQHWLWEKRASDIYNEII